MGHCTIVNIGTGVRLILGQRQKLKPRKLAVHKPVQPASLNHIIERVSQHLAISIGALSNLIFRNNFKRRQPRPR